MEFAEQIETLRLIREGDGEQFSNDQILAVGIAEYPGAVDADTLAKEADLRLVELLEDPMAI